MWLSFCANPVRGRGQPRGTRTCNQVHRALGTPRARSGHAAPVFLVHRGLRPLKNGQNDVRAGLRPPSQVHLFAKNEGVGSQQGLAHHVAGPWAFVSLEMLRVAIAGRRRRARGGADKERDVGHDGGAGRGSRSLLWSAGRERPRAIDGSAASRWTRRRGVGWPVRCVPQPASSANWRRLRCAAAGMRPATEGTCRSRPVRRSKFKPRTSAPGPSARAASCSRASPPGRRPARRPPGPGA